MSAPAVSPNRLAVRCNKLIVKGRRVLSAMVQEGGSKPLVDPEKYAEWYVLALVLLLESVGHDHPYVQHFPGRADDPQPSNVHTGLGILSALKDDFAAGDWNPPPGR
jgi:hypothetical protein